MTIGIAVSGPRAGLAAFRALEAVERIGRGAIGGFVSFAVISEDRELLRAETQRGGTRTLFTAGETTGVAPPEPFANARLAVLMSSGPDRPTPLSQFTPGDAAVGLITGHRLPNTPGADGRPLNLWLLDTVRGGMPAHDAVASFRDRHGDDDAGIIFLAADGTIALANTARVQRRDDGGAALVDDARSGVTVGVLHNAIFPREPIAAVATGVAVDTVVPADRWDFEIEVAAGLPLVRGGANRVHISPDRRALRIEVDRPEWLSSRWDGAALHRGAEVVLDEAAIGTIVFEPYCVAADGQLVSMSGRDRIFVGVRTLEDHQSVRPDPPLR